MLCLFADLFLAWFHSSLFLVTLCPVAPPSSCSLPARYCNRGFRLFFQLSLLNPFTTFHLQLLVLFRLNLARIRFMVSQEKGGRPRLRTDGYLGVFRVWSAWRVVINIICLNVNSVNLCVVRQIQTCNIVVLTSFERLCSVFVHGLSCTRSSYKVKQSKLVHVLITLVVTLDCVSLS